MSLKIACTVDEACGALGIRKTKFFGLVKSGELRSFKIGRRTLVHIDELHRFVAQAQQD